MQQPANTSPVVASALTAIAAADAANNAGNPAAVVTGDAPAADATPTTTKPKAAKPSKRTATPTPAPAAADTSDRDGERKAAAEAVRNFYTGRSLPFKSASDTFADFRTDKQPKAATERQAALVAAMLLAGDNIKPNGTFTRGGFMHDGKRVQPETGCLSDMHGRIVKHVSGPLGGKQARDAVFKLDLRAARGEIERLLSPSLPLRKQALAKLDKLAPAKPAKAA